MIKQKLRNEIDKEYKWNLEAMYQDIKAIEADMKTVKFKTDELLKYQGHILDESTNFLAVIELNFSIGRLISKLHCYANMKYHEDTTVNKSLVLVGKIDNLLVDIMEKLSFIEQEIVSNDFSLIEKYLSENKSLKKYELYLKKLFITKPYSLSLKEEKLLARESDVLSTANDIYDVINDTDMFFSNIKDEEGNIVELTNSNYSKYLSSDNREVRKHAFKSLYKGYDRLKNTLATCLIKEIKSTNFIASVRGYKDPLEMSLLSDQIDRKLYSKLITQVIDRLNIVYKYLDIRKQIMNVKKLHMYDLYNPIIEWKNVKYSFAEAKDIVQKALSVLGKEYIEVIDKAFSDKWIDVYNNKGKKSGAYSWGCYDSNPYLLLNYEDRLDDVFALAHELGHSAHSYYSNTYQPYEYSNYSVFVAEIASTVNEMLVNRYLIAKSKSREEKLYILSYLLDSYRTTLIRPTMFAEFEKIIYDKNSSGEILTEELISDIYLDLNKKYYGKIFHDKEIRLEWSRIPHFYNNFYVYQYATGIAIATKIVKEIFKNNTSMINNYLQFLKSGDSDYPLNILKKCGIDILNDDTINEALDDFEETLNEFIELYNKE